MRGGLLSETMAQQGSSGIASEWLFASLTSEQQEVAHRISADLDVLLVVGEIMARRGIRSVEEAKSFILPDLSTLHNPYLLEDMEVAVRRLCLALECGERILIYGDYDVDGTTAVALVYCVLRDQLGSDRLSYYIPDRNDEGYGISEKAITSAKSQGVSLIIALDCGIKAHTEIAYAKSLGIDCIVCDHHRSDDVLPPAFAVLNPMRDGNEYPNTYLSGCGVGFKLMQALVTTWGLSQACVDQYLDLVAISIAADIVPVVGENRTMVYYGLKQLNSAPSLGIKELIRLTDLSGEVIDMSSIVFKIAPRINASGRMMSGGDAVALLISRTEVEAKKWGARLEEYNKQRRALDLLVTDEAVQMIRAMGDITHLPIFVLYAPHWHRGVLGIVASRLTERYNRPTIVLSRGGDGAVVGSARSMRGINLYKALESCQEYLINFGGHTHAVGLTIEEDCIDAFREALVNYFHNHVERDEQVRQILIDAELKIEEIQPELQRQIQLLAPFGLMNEQPVFATYRLRDAGGSRLVGRDNGHIKLRMTDRYCKHRPIHGIALRQAHHIDWIVSQKSFAACYTMQTNGYYGKTFLQLQIKDISTEYREREDGA